MAAMTTALVYSDQPAANTLLFTLPDHTAAKASTVRQKRQRPQGNETVYQNVCTFVKYTTDGDGNVLPTPYLYEIRERGPINGQTADRDSNIVKAHDFVNSDEHDNNFLAQNPIKAL